MFYADDNDSVKKKKKEKNNGSGETGKLTERYPSGGEHRCGRICGFRAWGRAKK